MINFRCPQNPTHDKFTVSARTITLWTVDGRGNYISQEGVLDVDLKECSEDSVCAICHCLAVVEITAE